MHGPEVVERAYSVCESRIEVLTPTCGLTDHEGGQDSGERVVGGAKAGPWRVVEDRPGPETEIAAGEYSNLCRHDALVGSEV